MSNTATTITRTASQNTSAPSHEATAQANAHLETVQARGLGIYLGLSEELAASHGTSLRKIVEALNATLHGLVPEAQSHAVVALAPRNAHGRDVDIVRLALNEPEAKRLREKQKRSTDRSGVLIDTSRKQVLLDGQKAALTYREFELLQFLVLREGRAVSRQELIDGLWREDADDRPNDRTIDVHIRRLRAKLGDFQDIIITIRGLGYRFDRHADVIIRTPHAASPDAH
ncbi:MAG: winged helix-turn-helix domain-containing protein [Microbacteriaceae bacterium]